MNELDKKNILGIVKGFRTSNEEENKQRISVEGLAGLSHLEERTVKDIVKELRRQGERIAGSSQSGGYYWAENAEQFRKDLNSKRAGLITGYHTYKAMKKTLLAMQQDGSMDNLV
jgi:hypothetical protein